MGEQNESGTSQGNSEGFSETDEAEPGVQVAGADNFAAMPGRALVKFNNDSINAQLE